MPLHFCLGNTINRTLNCKIEGSLLAVESTLLITRPTDTYSRNVQEILAHSPEDHPSWNPTQ